MSGDDRRYEVWWDGANSVARVDWLPGAVCELHDALGVSTDLQRLGRGPVLTLVDIRKLESIDRASRQHFMTTHESYRAVALVADAPVGRLIGNLFMAAQRPRNPTRMFSSPDQAIEWLHQQP